MKKTLIILILCTMLLLLLVITPQCILYNKGLAFDYMGRYEEALEDFDKAIELDQNDEYIENRELVRSELKEQNYVSGFEALFAIAGLLALAYLLRRETK